MQKQKSLWFSQSTVETKVLGRDTFTNNEGLPKPVREAVTSRCSLHLLACCWDLLSWSESMVQRIRRWSPCLSLVNYYKPIVLLNLSYCICKWWNCVTLNSFRVWKQNTGLHVLLENILTFMYMMIFGGSEEQEWNNGYEINEDRIAKGWTLTC